MSPTNLSVGFALVSVADVGGSGGGVLPGVDRITESGDERVTETGDVRVTES